MVKKKMRAVVLRGIGRYSVEELPVPEPKEGEVLVRVETAGVCRTDLKIIEVGHRDLELPRVPAEEVVGVVSGLGPGVDGNWLGKRVYIYPGTSCGECDRCLAGAGNLCVKMRIMGFHRDGGFAEYVSAPIASVIELPDSLDFDSAVFAEPLSCCLNALELARVEAGDKVGVWGAGPAGALLARAARRLGAEVTVVEPDPDRRKFSGALESAPAAPCFDVAIPAVGSPEAYRSAFQALLPRGRLVAFSGLVRDAASGLVDLNELHYLERTCVGAYGCSFRHGEQAIGMIADGSVEVDDLVSHEMSLDEMPTALDLVKQRKCMKILIHPNKERNV